jgi:hypothetical protein
MQLTHRDFLWRQEDAQEDALSGNASTVKAIKVRLSQ